MAGGGSPSSTSTLTARQKTVLRRLGDTIIPNVGKPAQGYTGSRVAPLEPGYDAARAMIESYGATAGEFDEPVKVAVRRMLAGEPSFALDPATMREYFDKSVAAPAIQTFDREIAPRLSASFAARGGTFSTRRGEATQQALGDLQNSLAGQYAQTAWSAQQLGAQLAEAAANRQAAAIPLAQQVAAQPLARAQAMTQTLAPFQQQAQAGADAAYEEFLRTSPENSPWNTLALQYMGVPATALYQKGANPMVGAGIGAAGGALSGAMMGSVVPGIGTAIGAGIGALAGGLSGYASGPGAGISSGGGLVGAFGQAQNNQAMLNYLNSIKPPTYPD